MNEDAEAGKAHVLIVDDTPANLQLLAGILTSHGYVVHAAAGARLALRFLQTASPDIVLLDIRMPELDGYEVCAMLKRDERTRDTPVIFISSAEQAGDKVLAFAAGGVDYVVKPFQPEEVLARVSTHLSLRSLQRRLEDRVAQRTAELSRAQEALVQNQRLLQAIIDHAAALISVKDDQGRYLLANRRFNALFSRGATRAIVGATDFDIFPAATAAALRSADARAMAAGGISETEEVLTGEDGPRTYISSRTVLHGIGGALDAVCCIATDITERVREELALRTLNDLLEARLAERTAAPARDPQDS